MFCMYNTFQLCHTPNKMTQYFPEKLGTYKIKSNFRFQKLSELEKG